MLIVSVIVLYFHLLNVVNRGDDVFIAFSVSLSFCFFVYLSGGVQTAAA